MRRWPCLMAVLLACGVEGEGEAPRSCEALCRSHFTPILTRASRPGLFAENCECCVASTQDDPVQYCRLLGGCSSATRVGGSCGDWDPVDRDPMMVGTWAYWQYVDTSSNPCLGSVALMGGNAHLTGSALVTFCPYSPPYAEAWMGQMPLRGTVEGWADEDSLFLTLSFPGLPDTVLAGTRRVTVSGGALRYYATGSSGSCWSDHCEGANFQVGSY